MFDEPLFATTASHETEINPHRLLNSCLPNVHRLRIWQIRRPVLPRGKRWAGVLRTGGPQTNAERRSEIATTAPSLPKQGWLCILILGFCLVAYPHQLNHGVGKGKTATGCTLPWMLIWRSLAQSELDQLLGLGSTWSCADE